MSSIVEFIKSIKSYFSQINSSLLGNILTIAVIIGLVNIDLNRIAVNQSLNKPLGIIYTERVLDKGKFQVIYSPLKQESFVNIQERFQKEQSFETVAQALSKIFIMPRDINIILGDCGFINAYYKPSAHSIYMCYEIMQSFTERFIEYYKANNYNINQPQVADEIAQRVAGTIIFSLFHELGHLLIGELDLPVIGKEEDAVDEFSTLLLSELGQEKANLAAALQFAVAGNQEMTIANQSLHFWEEHSLSMQRFYSLICLVYGKDYQKYASLVKEVGIPEIRQKKCQIDYNRKRKAWHTLLKPHLHAGVHLL
ncbi:MAG TPA: DUF4344 domain-containing metallopeptidase [Nostocaceae cyanobacterium]|nr:DUF4344 domain-containing metallopeptidase [Nostocaceae cyanobacterium]